MLRQSLIIIIALILSAIVWWIGPLVSIGFYVPLRAVWVRGVIITLILVWALWPMVAAILGWLFRHARAPQLEHRRRHLRDRVTARFFDAIKTLKAVGIASRSSGWQRISYRWRKGYINDLPWFLVLGPTGSGKTSLINESGKRFLLSEQYGFTQISDVGPTLDCNWWLTDRAVYIDTAGEWAQLHGQSEESCRAQKKLFTLIRCYRRKPGIDGIILCLDGRWLMQASLTERKSLADTLRVRMLEIADHFHQDIAVYLAINQLDTLPGGAAFLSVASEEILEQGLGIQLVKNAYGQLDFVAAEEAFVRLSMHISDYIQQRLQAEPRADVRRQLLFFTEATGALHKPLFNFLEQVFVQSAGYYCGRLQQIWLGSTTAIQHAGFNSLSPIGDWQSKAIGQIYAPLLDNAIAERGVIDSHKLPARERIGRALRYGFTLALLAFVGKLLAVQYFWEEEYIAYITARFDETKRIVREIPTTNQLSDDVVSAYEQLGYMTAQLSNNVTPLSNPYLEHRLINRAAEQTYHRHLFKFFWPAIERYITSELGRDISAGDADVYNTLKVYLMLGKAEHRSADALVNWFMKRWSSFVPQGYSPADKRLFTLHLREMFSGSLQSMAPVTSLSADLVRLARVKAMNIPMHVRVVRALQARAASSSIENITLATAAGANVSLMLRRKSTATVSDIAVPAFYTLASYHDVFRAQLDSAVKAMINEEAWVLKDEDRSKVSDMLTSEQKLADEVRKLYLQEYADSWDAFLKDIRVRPVGSLDDAAQLARQFSDPSSPLANLIRFATRQTSLDGSQQNNVSSWFGRKKSALENVRRDVVGEISGERSRFRITPEKALEQRFEVLRRLGQQLMQSVGGNSDPLARSFEELYNQLSSLAFSLRAGEVIPQNSAINRLRMSAARQPEPVRSVMQDLLDVGDSKSLQISRNNLNKGAASFAADLCRNKVAGRYPFVRNAKKEIGIDDFSRMFAPSGSIRRYFIQNLEPYVDTHSGNWRVKDSRHSLLSSGTLQAFQQASLISDTFFTAGSDNLSFSMFLRPLSLSPEIVEAVLDIDGQIIRYSHGSSQPVNIRWPGKNGGAYVRLSFKDVNGKIQTASFNGPWALFHLYDKSNPLMQASDRRELSMAIAGIRGMFKVELLSTMKDFPLWSTALSQFSCPAIK
jgi:type VI secretion system protein ImpL